MFTGIIEAVGSIQSIKQVGGDVALTVNVHDLLLDDVDLGDSIAVNGVCLTVISFDKASFTADVSTETLSLTSLGQLQNGSSVNLEKALTLSTKLGGHLVSGHVDGLAELIERKVDSRSERFIFKAPESLQHYIAHKGSITIDGVSLTVNAIQENIFDVNIVPHTQEQTIIQHYRIGSHVNIEVDVIARYLERLMTGKKSDSSESEMTAEWLLQQGLYKA